MQKLLSTCLALWLIATALPAMAQQAAPQQWPGPWWMWSDGS